MSQVIVEMFTDDNPQDALVVVAFHSTGAAGAIAAGYLRENLSLPLVGHVRSSGIGPVAVIQDGIATSPIRIYGGEVECRLDEGCPRMYLVSAELPIDPALSEDIAQSVVEWARRAKLILCLDAASRQEGDDEPDVFAVAQDAAGLAALEPTKAPPMGGGVLAGLTAATLTSARDCGVRGAALVVEAARNHPDARAAAALVTHIDPLLPDIRVDAGPLMEEAVALEAKLAKAMKEAEAAQPKRAAHTFI